MIYESSVDMCTINNVFEKMYFRSAGCHSTLWKDHNDIVFIVTVFFDGIMVFF